jgi:hypothetical protein
MSLCYSGQGSTFRSGDPDRFPRGDANVLITGQLPRIAPEIFPACPSPDPSAESHASVVSLSTLEAVAMASGLRIDPTAHDFCLYGVAVGIPYLRALLEQAEHDPSILALPDGVGCPTLVYNLRHLARTLPPITLRDCLKTEQGHAWGGQDAVPGDDYTGGDRDEPDSDDEPGLDHYPPGRLRATLGDVAILQPDGSFSSELLGFVVAAASMRGRGRNGRMLEFDLDASVRFAQDLAPFYPSPGASAPSTDELTARLVDSGSTVGQHLLAIPQVFRRPVVRPAESRREIIFISQWSSLAHHDVVFFSRCPEVIALLGQDLPLLAALLTDSESPIDTLRQLNAALPRDASGTEYLSVNSLYEWENALLPVADLTSSSPPAARITKIANRRAQLTADTLATNAFAAAASRAAGSPGMGGGDASVDMTDVTAMRAELESPAARAAQALINSNSPAAHLWHALNISHAARCYALALSPKNLPASTPSVVVRVQENQVSFEDYFKLGMSFDLPRGPVRNDDDGTATHLLPLAMISASSLLPDAVLPPSLVRLLMARKLDSITSQEWALLIAARHGVSFAQPIQGYLTVGDMPAPLDMIAHHLPELLNLLGISSEGPGLPDLLESLRQWQSVEGAAAPGEHERRITITFEKVMKDITKRCVNAQRTHGPALPIKAVTPSDSSVAYVNQSLTQADEAIHLRRSKLMGASLAILPPARPFGPIPGPARGGGLVSHAGGGGGAGGGAPASSASSGAPSGGSGGGASSGSAVGGGKGGGSGGGASSGSAVGGGKGGGNLLVVGGKGAVSLDPGRPPSCKPRKVLERPIPKAGAAASFDSTASHYILVLSASRVLFHRDKFDTLLLRFGTAAFPLTAGSFLVSPLLAPVGNQQAARTFLSNENLGARHTHVDFVLPHNDWFSKVLIRSCIDVSASGGSANLPPYFQ